MKVFILSSLPNPDLRAQALLVFRTIRTGFPTADVQVHVRGDHYQDVVDAVAGKDVHVWRTDMIHYDWLAELIQTQSQPFYICDTDMVFWQSMEGFRFDTALAGKYVPQFKDPITGCISRDRLHTSLLYVDPLKVRMAVYKYMEQFSNAPFVPHPNLHRPTFMPVNGLTYFWDTGSALYQVVGGEHFTAEHSDCYEHLHCGTYTDIADKAIPGFKAAQEKVMANPEIARGIWRHQDDFFKAHAA